MAFREIMEGLDLPEGASPRYRTLEALGRMLAGTFYDDIDYAFDQETRNDGKYIPLRERRPSTDFNLAFEITQDTLAELFGDEQFPIVQVVTGKEPNDDATAELQNLIEALEIDQVVSDGYEEGVVGAAAVVVHRSDEGTPFYDVLPAKWCEPVYAGEYSNKIIALVVTYPISREQVDEKFPGFTDKEENQADAYWYRYVIGPVETVDYLPMTDRRFAKLGEKDDKGEVIEFVEHTRVEHGFAGRTPIVYTKNLRGKRREPDGPSLWWPIRNFIVEIDYTLSQAGRGLRYTADPMLFVRKGDMFGGGTAMQPAGYQPRNQAPAAGMATLTDGSGKMVRGASQVLEGGPGSDAKVLEISANGIKEEREYAKDLREYSLEVIGGMKARSENVKAASSGKAIDKQSKPLRRLVRRQRRPYGNGMLLEVLDLTLYGYSIGVFDRNPDVDLSAIPLDSQRVLEWPNDEVLQGADLLDHVTGLQMAAGGSAMNPKELISPDAIGARMASDIGFHQPYDKIKGTGDALTPPVVPETTDPAPAG